MTRVRIVWLTVMLMLVAPICVHAKTMDITCSQTYGNSFSFIVDTTKNTVEANGNPTSNVSVNQDYISFWVELKGKWWHNVINRNTGELTLDDPDGTHTHGFICEQSKQRF